MILKLLDFGSPPPRRLPGMTIGLRCESLGPGHEVPDLVNGSPAPPGVKSARVSESKIVHQWIEIYFSPLYIAEPILYEQLGLDDAICTKSGRIEGPLEINVTKTIRAHWSDITD